MNIVAIDCKCNHSHLISTNNNTFVWKGGKEFNCISAVIDMGADVPDPGVISDGTKCDNQKICINHKCTPISSLNIPKCDSQQCSNHGVRKWLLCKITKCRLF